MKKIILMVIFVSSLLSASNDIENLPNAKIVSTHDCVGINLNVNFKTNSNEIEQGSFVKIKDFADFMLANPTKNALIVGYTDSRGSAVYNKSLSQRRAKAVYLKIVDYGVSQSRLSHEGYGEENPIATNDTPEGRRANRRIEAKLH